MNLKKPKFWDYRKPNIYSYLLLPISIVIQIIIFFKKNLIKKKKIQHKNCVYWKFIYWWNR